MQKFLNFAINFFCVRLSTLNIILKKFLKFGKSSLDDSYKKDSYKENSVYTEMEKNPITPNMPKSETSKLSHYTETHYTEIWYLLQFVLT